MKTITDHQINECNRAISIADLGGDGTREGVLYKLAFLRAPDAAECETLLRFQDGPIKDGVNGLTNEALLAVLIDRLRGFQSGPFSCRENACALTKLEEAKHWLEARTKARVQRGVEGTHAV